MFGCYRFSASLRWLVQNDISGQLKNVLFQYLWVSIAVTVVLKNLADGVETGERTAVLLAHRSDLLRRRLQLFHQMA